MYIDMQKTISTKTDNKYVFVRIPHFRLNRMIFLLLSDTRQHIKATIKKYLKAITNCSAKPAQSELQSQTVQALAMAWYSEIYCC